MSQVGWAWQSPHGHEPLGRSRPSGALPRDWVAILSLHRPPAVLPKERAAPPGLSAMAVTSTEPGLGKG